MYCQIDYFGVKSTHLKGYELSPRKIQLCVLVSDSGNPKPAVDYLPSESDGFPMKDFSVHWVGHKIDIPSAQDYLRVRVLAYSSEDVEVKKAIVSWLQLFGAPGADELQRLIDLLPVDKELVGHYDRSYAAAENWGIAPRPYEAEGSGDLELWFRIWSGVQPPESEQPVLNPEIVIDNLVVPTEVRAPYGYQAFSASHTLTLRNDEALDIPVTYRATSSVTGQFDQGQSTVPRNSVKTITKSFPYGEPLGPREITYEVFYDNRQIGNRSTTITVVPFVPDVRIASLSVPAQAKQTQGFVTYPVTHKLVLANDEQLTVTVTWKANSTVKGDFDSGTATIAPRSEATVSKQYWYDPPLGTRTLTYTVWFGSTKVAEQTATITVVP